ncbi:MBL fold metallo-hydrolase [Yokenella regensburgei]|uniref:MBL fold metallo-hydrolase n=1 Tax=Yokenella regensburgei TaxID=158877 RepID=UPI0005708515|nr:MBL fold metallo-hydrolase [Yokenella regensburgei]SQA66851.1 Uncharacterised protein [Yokenella regensburgei]SUQ05300.1 Uncharacterised protein [Yokenella regensburgei]
MITLCNACGTSYDTANGRVEHSKICEDERQYVPVSGQAWITPEALAANHSNIWRQLEPQLFSIRTEPTFAINQRAILLRTPEGNVLWDCVANLDPATRTLVAALGGLSAIAISHPHYYTTMQDWARTFNAPVYLHANDREWVMRSSPAIRFWEGDSLQILPDVRLLRLGGHFPGGTVLHWREGSGVILAGDIVQVTPGADAVSFMWSYPNMLPLAAKTVEGVIQRLQDVPFGRLYGAFAWQNITERADEIVQQSGKRYIACLR